MTVVTKGIERKYETNVIVETFLILRKLLEAKGSMGLSQLCQSTRITKNKAFRILATLNQCEIVDKDERSNYNIGVASIEMAHKIFAKASVWDEVRLSMKCLSKTINEAVYLAKYNGNEAVFVDFVDCIHSIKAAPLVGAAIQIPDTVTAARGNSVVRIGNITVDTESLSAEITTVSIPYFNRHGVEIGLLVVLAPTYRMTPDRIKAEIVPALRNVIQSQQLHLHDSLQERVLPVINLAGRAYTKYPHFVSGGSTKTTGSQERSCSAN